MSVATRDRPSEAPTLDDLFEKERRLVGLILAHPAAIERIAPMLRGEDWTHPLHRGVFEVAERLAAEKTPVSFEIVLPHVGDVGPDGLSAGAYLAARIAEAPPLTRALPLARALAKAAPLRTRPDIYTHDAYSWAFEQAQKLRRGNFSSLDALNLAEEIEDLGNEIYNRLESALRITLMHLLRWDRQPKKRTRSWTLSIRNGRLDIEDLIERHPGLKSRVPSAIERAFRRARLEAVAETGIDESAFPERCPYPLDDIMGRPIDWPSHPDDA